MKHERCRLPDSVFNILCLGDVVGQPGMDAIDQHLRHIVHTHRIDFTVLNIENAASGFGFNQRLYNRFQAMGVDAFTTGNHVYAKRDVMDRFDEFDCLVRPHNWPAEHPGTGVRVFRKHDQKVAVVNIIGRAFMMQPSDCPFRTMDAILRDLDASIILVDFHAETTSEKQALGWYLRDKVTAFYGTHTHVQTNDCRMLSNKTAYITDIGMCGAYDSVIGMDIGVSINKFLTQLPARHVPVKQPKQHVIGGMVVSVDVDHFHIVGLKALHLVTDCESN